MRRIMGTHDWDPREMVDTLGQRRDDDVSPDPWRRADGSCWKSRGLLRREWGRGGQWKGISVSPWAHIR